MSVAFAPRTSPMRSGTLDNRADDSDLLIGADRLGLRAAGTGGGEKLTPQRLREADEIARELLDARGHFFVRQLIAIE